MHLAEEFYVRAFAIACVILIAGCALTLWFAALDRGTPAMTTMLFASLAAAFGIAGLARPHDIYLRLRSRTTLQLSAVALGALAVLLDGPESECWWIALPLLWILATLSSARLAAGAAIATATAFVAGTILGGQALVTTGDLGVLPATVALPAYTLVGWVLIDALAGLALTRDHVTADNEPHTPPPLRVANLETAMKVPTASPAASPPTIQHRPRRTSRLTVRQLEVALLLRDGLRQTEIAACLGISVRQVERLLAAARERVHATTTTQLVAMLAAGALSPHPTVE
ncbi:MAG TPA: helix-turn-helix transcriptional regulator [Solirubrobacteraceae bacterium]